MSAGKPKRGRPPKDKTKPETAALPAPGELHSDVATIEEDPQPITLSPTPTEVVQPEFHIKDVVRSDIYDAHKQMEKEYWIGCLPGAPFHNFTFGGFSFPVTTYTPGRGPNGKATSHIGNVVKMTPKQLNHTLECIQAKVIRATGSGKNLRYLKKDTRGEDKRGFVPSPTDMACGRFVYVVEYNDSVARHKTPDPLIK